jgi:hypothetical protein
VQHHGEVEKWVETREEKLDWTGKMGNNGGKLGKMGKKIGAGLEKVGTM